MQPNLGAPLLAILAATTASLGAQTITMPKGYAATEAGYFSNYVGAFAEQRIQLLDGDHQGSGTARSFKNLALRRPVGLERVNSARSWSSVSLSIGDHDFAKGSTTFSKNHLSTPAMVFSGSVAWPATTGTPSTNPGVWGVFAQSGDMQFPFSSPFKHSGTFGLCVDFRFRGGKLTNGASFSNFVPYYHDGIRDALGNSSTTGVTRLFGNDNCKVAGRSGPHAFYPTCETTAKDSAFLPDQILLDLRAEYLPANAACFGVIAFSGLPKGQGYLTSCNSLFLNLAPGFVPYPFVASKAGGMPASTPSFAAKYQVAFVGAEIYTQCAFDAGKPASVELSKAGVTAIRVQPAKHKQARLYTYGATVGAATGWRYTTRLPVLRLQ